MDAAAGLGVLGLMIGGLGLVVGLVFLWLVVRDATRASHVVARLDGVNRRLDAIAQMLGEVGRILNERLPRGGQQP